MANKSRKKKEKAAESIRSPLLSHSGAPPIVDEAVSSPSVARRDSETATLAAVLLVHFDSRLGNTLSFFHPESVSTVVRDVEFKAIPSGAHSVKSDLVYFKHNGLYGAAAFRNARTDEPGERGARMIAVGVLCSSPDMFSHHLKFLQSESAVLCNDLSAVDGLVTYYGKALALSPRHGSTSPRSSLIPNMPDWSSRGVMFVQFLHRLGESSLLLWKALLLEKRILIYSSVPVGPACENVFCSRELVQASVRSSAANPIFYVSMHDFDWLKSMHSFIGCVSDRVFQERPGEIWDVYIGEDGRVHTADDSLKLSKCDRKRWAELKNIMALHGFDGLVRYFKTLNRCLCERLLDEDVAMLPNGQPVNNVAICTGDVGFIRELCAVYGIEPNLQNAFCWCLGCCA